MFVYGTQYLRGATPEKDQWEKDLIKMKSLGFNTIRAWLVWNAIERSEGIIDEQYLHDFLSLAEGHEMNVGLLFHLHAAPAWAIEKYPQYYYVNENDEAFRPATRANTPSGGWPGLCFDHEEVRVLEKSFIERVISIAKQYKCVTFYEPMNEPHQWVNLNRNSDDSFCYCPATKATYRQWLQNKYETIDALNDAWGVFYNDFSQIHPPRWCATYIESIEFRKFTMENIAKEVAFRVGIIKQCDDKPVIAHAWGGGMIGCSNLGSMAFDDWKNAQMVDKWGFSAFPRSDEDCCMLALGCNGTRCAAGDKDYWQAELGAGLIGTGLTQMGRLNTKTFLKLAVESIRYGAKGLLFWQFRKERIGTEFGGFALSDYNGNDTNLSIAASDLCRAIQKNEAIFENVEVPKAKVALVLSVGAYLVDWCSTNRKNNKFAVDSTSGYYKMFWEENIPVDIIHEDFVGDLSQYRLIVVTAPYAISEKCAEALRFYVQGGGTLLSDPYFAAFDREYKLSREVPGMGFDEVFGGREDDMRMQESLRLYSDTSSYTINGNRHRENFRDVGGEIVCRYEDSSAAIIKQKYGKGEAILSGVNLGLSYSSKRLIADDILSNDKNEGNTDVKRLTFDICGFGDALKNPCNTPNVACSFVCGNENTAYDLLYIINNNSKKANGNIVCKNKYLDAEIIFGEGNACLNEISVSFALAEDAVIILKLKKHDTACER